jgi:hypothetical protein
MYPSCYIDKVRERGETWAVDPEMREAFDRLGADLRGEMQTFATDLRGEIRASAAGLRGEIQTSAAETRAYVDDRLQTSTVEMRRDLEAVGESLRSDIRAVAEGVVFLGQRVDRGFAEQGGQVGGLDRRVLRLEVRVKSLEDDRKTRRPRRRR